MNLLKLTSCLPLTNGSRFSLVFFICNWIGSGLIWRGKKNIRHDSITMKPAMNTIPAAKIYSTLSYL